MAEYMYNVAVVKTEVFCMSTAVANAVFDDAIQALNFAERHVYIPNPKWDMYHSMLLRGETVNYAYGFNTVSIVPVAKRKIKT